MSCSGAIEISERRIARIVSTVCSIIDCEFVISARCLLSCTVVGSVSRIMTRHCCITSTCAPYWDAFLGLDQYMKDEIIFWKENIDFVKSWVCFLDRKVHVFGFSDAKATGCGAVISLDSLNVCLKFSDSSEASKSSTWRELAATDFTIESFSSVLESSNVQWYTRLIKQRQKLCWHYETRSS